MVVNIFLICVDEYIISTYIERARRKLLIYLFLVVYYGTE